MNFHYLKIALRNILKYRMQSLVSISGMAVSLSLLAIVTSLLVNLTGTPLLRMPYADRVVKLNFSDTYHRSFTQEKLDLIKGHSFTGVEKMIEVHDCLMSASFVAEGEDGKRELLGSVEFVDPTFLGWAGYRSACTRQPLPGIGQDEVVISKALAERLFGEANPTGRMLYVDFHSIEHQQLSKSYKIVDVKEAPSLNDNLRRNTYENVFMAPPSAPPYTTDLYFQLQENYSLDDFKAQVDDLFPDREKSINLFAKMIKSNENTMARIRDGIFVFLLSFLLLQASSYLRQQMQLFRFRQREIALRTTMGAKRGQILWQMCLEVSVVLIATLCVSLLVSYNMRAFMMNNLPNVLNEMNWALDSILPITLSVFALLLAIAAAACGYTLWKIRRDQTGLALQMKHRPKHRLRNAGIATQLAVCTFFVAMTLLFSFTETHNYYVPDNDDYYRTGLYLRINGYTEPEKEELIEELKSVANVECIVPNALYARYYRNGDEGIGLNVLKQKENEMAEFYNVEIVERRQVSTPGHSVSVSHYFKEWLEERGLWNGSTLQFDGEVYEIDGFFDRIPYQTPRCIIITDERIEEFSTGSFVIMPKRGKAREVRNAVNDAVHRVFPTRIDIKCDKLYPTLAPEIIANNMLVNIIYILGGISLVTTMATIYSSVSLDTRRRRKEMALRKVNGAKTKDICRIFAKSYVAIMAAAYCMALFAGIVLLDSMLGAFDEKCRLSPGSCYLWAVTLATLFVFFTVAWKIRDVMRINPIEYLKE